MTDKQIKHIKSIIENKSIKTFGVEISLTDEQVKEFEKMVKPKYKIPYERVDIGEEYYGLELRRGEMYVIKLTHYNDVCSKENYENCNHINNKEFAEQIAMEYNLKQKLRKFTYDNGWSEELWEDSCKEKYLICFDMIDNVFKEYPSSYSKRRDIYYTTREIAQRAIEEIIRPFMKENPTFKW